MTARFSFLSKSEQKCFVLWLDWYEIVWLSMSGGKFLFVNKYFLCIIWQKSLIKVKLHGEHNKKLTKSSISVCVRSFIFAIYDVCLSILVTNVCCNQRKLFDEILYSIGQQQDKRKWKVYFVNSIEWESWSCVFYWFVYIFFSVWLAEATVWVHSFVMCSSFLPCSRMSNSFSFRVLLLFIGNRHVVVVLPFFTNECVWRKKCSKLMKSLSKFLLRSIYHECYHMFWFELRVEWPSMTSEKSRITCKWTTELNTEYNRELFTNPHRMLFE